MKSVCFGSKVIVLSNAEANTSEPTANAFARNDLWICAAMVWLWWHWKICWYRFAACIRSTFVECAVNHWDQSTSEFVISGEYRLSSHEMQLRWTRFVIIYFFMEQNKKSPACVRSSGHRRDNLVIFVMQMHSCINLTMRMWNGRAAYERRETFFSSVTTKWPRYGVDWSICGEFTMNYDFMTSTQIIIASLDVQLVIYLQQQPLRTQFPFEMHNNNNMYNWFAESLSLTRNACFRLPVRHMGPLRWTS